jgi:hypothetical protein
MSNQLWTPLQYQLDSSRLYELYTGVFYGLYLVAIGVFLLVLFRIRKAQHSFANTVLTYKIVSDASGIFEWLILEQINPAFQKTEQMTVLSWLGGIMVFLLCIICFACYNLAIWLFAYHYFDCQVRLSYVH